MKISKKKQAIIDALQTQKEKDDYINELKMEHKEKVKEKVRKYRKKNPEKVKEINARYRKANPEKTKESNAKYRKENPDKVKELNAKYHKENADELRNKRVIYLAKKKAEKQLIESIIDGRKLAIELKQEKAYEWLINDNDGSYSEDKHQLGIVLVNNLRFMSDDYNNAEYGTYEAWTKENIDAVCVMLDEMFEFCNKRQIKYINLN